MEWWITLFLVCEFIKSWHKRTLVKSDTETHYDGPQKSLQATPTRQPTHCIWSYNVSLLKGQRRLFMSPENEFWSREKRRAVAILHDWLSCSSILSKSFKLPAVTILLSRVLMYASKAVNAGERGPLPSCRHGGWHAEKRLKKFIQHTSRIKSMLTRGKCQHGLMTSTIEICEWNSTRKSPVRIGNLSLWHSKELDESVKN